MRPGDRAAIPEREVKDESEVLRMREQLHMAAASTLPGLAQAAATLLTGTLGWVLFIGLVVSAIVCFFTKHHGAFAVDLAFAVFVGFFIFNPPAGEALLKSASNAL